MGALARHIQRLERMALPPTGGPRVIRLLSSRQLRRQICWFWPVVQWLDHTSPTLDCLRIALIGALQRLLLGEQLTDRGAAQADAELSLDQFSAGSTSCSA